MMAGTTFTVGCVQMTSGLEVAGSVADACNGVRKAKDQGAELVLLPEAVNIIDLDKKRLLQKLDYEDGNPAVTAFQAIAKATGVWLLVGSIIVKIAEDRLANRSLLINPDGTITARYDKIHMFDVRLGDGENYTESALYEAGDQLVVAETPWGKLGMAICYDIRFPYLFRAMAKAGADFIALPAAFTRPTGEAHWHTLLRSRAIENGCFVFACGQCGTHEGGRQTYGHSLIIDPWGKVLVDGGEDATVITADIDPAMVATVRGKIPSLTHDRDFS